MGLPRLFAFQKGQGALLIIGVVVLLALVIGGGSLSQLAKSNAERTVAVKETLQTHYVAMAGVQQALASRMIPRSNYLAFNPTTAPYFTDTGIVYSNPTAKTGRIGVFRYVVVGGDSAHLSNGGFPGNFYDVVSPSGNDLVPSTTIPRAYAWDSMPSGAAPYNSPFFIISHGMTCDLRGRIDPNIISDPRLAAGAASLAIGDIKPTCAAGYTLNEEVLVARINYDPEGGGSDWVDNLRSFAGASLQSCPGGATPPCVSLTSYAFVPGAGWVSPNQRFSVADAWAYRGSNNSPGCLRRVVFYDRASYKYFGHVDNNNNCTQTTLTVPGNMHIPLNATVRLYFDGPVDGRTISKTGSLDDCTSNINNCNVVIQQGATKIAVANIVPVTPGVTQLILWPTFSGTLVGNAAHTLVVNGGATGLRTWSGQPIPATYNVNFQSCKLPGSSPPDVDPDCP